MITDFRPFPSDSSLVVEEKNNPKTSNVFYLAAALSFILILFFDVAFLQASLQPSNIVNHMGGAPDKQLVLYTPPDHNKVTTSYGYSDLGATSWQSEPARHFVARSLREDDSPYWNPYSASGSLGVSTLVDMKLSFFTLVSAWLFDSSALSFDFGYLIIYTLSCFCLLKFCHLYLQLHPAACLIAIVVFMMNGFASANYNSQNGFAYFVAPLLLYAVTRLLHRQTILNWTFCTIAHALMLTLTMLPVTFLAMATCHLIAFTLIASQTVTNKRDLSKLFRLYIPVVVSIVYAFLLCAFIWLPLLHNIGGTTVFGDYGRLQALHPYHWHNLFTVFSPKHFWEAYNSARPLEVLKAHGIQHNWGVMPHLGLTTCLTALFTLPFLFCASRSKKIMMGALWLLVLIPYLRMYGHLDFLEHIFFVNHISRNYWGTMSSLSFAILCAFGVHALIENKFSLGNWVTVTAAILAIALLFYAIFHPLLNTDYDLATEKFLLRIQLALGAFIALLIFSSFFPNKRHVASIALVLLIFAELFLYINHLRPKRFESADSGNLPGFVHFLRENIEEHKVLNIGTNNTLQPEFGAMLGIRQAGTNNSSLLPWYKDFFFENFGSDRRLFTSINSYPFLHTEPIVKGFFNHVALDISSIKYIVIDQKAESYVEHMLNSEFTLVFSEGPTRIFQNLSVRNSTYLTSRWRNTQDLDLILSRDEIITTDEALIESIEQLEIKKGDTCSSLETVSFKNTEVIYKSECPTAMILATSESWHPNWKAFVNDEETYIGMINQTFRGVVIPAGENTIRFSYNPWSIRVGLQLSRLAGAILIVITLFYFVRAFMVRKSA